MASKAKKIKTEDFDAKFEAGEDITEHLDLDSIVKRVNVDFPEWMVKALDAEADRLGVTRQSVIKVMIDEGIEKRKRA